MATEDFSWVVVYNGSQNSTTIKGLNASTVYYFRVASGNKVGLGGYSNSSFFQTPGLASPPILYFPRYTRDSITVAWNVSDFGGSLFSICTIFYSSDNLNWPQFSLQANFSQHTITGLETGTLYYFRMQASGQFGAGPISNLQNFSTAYPMCGDGTCDVTEACATCYFDCCENSTQTSISSCKPSCSNHGVCESGICKCESNWFGVDCSSNETVPITIILNNGTGIEIVIHPNPPLNYTTFDILIQSIKEIDPSGDIVASVSLDYLAYATLLIQTVTLPDNYTYTQYSYTFRLSNNANLSVLLSTFTTEHSISFAGQEVDIPPNGLKYNIEIEGWPFLNMQNRLSIGMQPTTPITNSKKGKCKSIQVSAGNSLQWFAIHLDGLQLYGKFMAHALLDGNIRMVEFTYNQAQEMIFLTVPFFWQKVEVDPQFSVLVDGLEKDDCGKQHTPKWVIVIAVVLPVVIALTIAATIYFIVKHTRDKNERTLIRMRARSNTAAY
eukprot:Phypoly_transcript_06610.p1 GENE.Phypoly_transcript_06610~~Phypoly_transcript_06610.p1  ORF type:complete len:550 (+),score=53.74 Phypoly_transcript_06610:161-1651(+)